MSRGILQEERSEIGSSITKSYRVYGKHIYGNLYNCRNRELLTDPKKLEEVVIKAAEIGNMTLLDVKSWKIGEGVSIVAIVLESHIAIHTWPEYNFATVDVYTCGHESDPQAAFDYIVSLMSPEKVTLGLADRSLE